MENRAKRAGGPRALSALLAVLLLAAFALLPGAAALAESPAASEGQWRDIVDVVVGEGFTVALRGDGSVLYAGEDFHGAAERIADWEQIERIELQSWPLYLIGYTEDGRIRLEALYDWELYPLLPRWQEEDFADWTDVRQLFLQHGCALALTGEGTVNTLPLEESWIELCGEVEGWTGIRQLAIGNSAILGLREDGTVLCADEYGAYTEALRERDDTKKIRELISSFAGIYAIDEEGTVVTGSLGPEWTNIASLYFADASMFGLRRDGTVAAYGADPGDPRIQAVAGWDHVVELGFDITGWARYVPVGLRDDGTACAVTMDYDGLSPYGDWDVAGWTGVRKLYSGTDYTIGVLDDGSLLVTGGEFGRADWLEELAGWTDIRAIYVSSTDDAPGHIVGLKNDGTLLAAGDNSQGQCQFAAGRHQGLYTIP